ncbi:hypothetical protein [Nocardia sp. NPDC005998]|uniref:hypothetical protein n=1 Tax=Nocardia sp. NPDC005998 TaxID=3156894 RepID=UPI00339E3D11
MRPTLVVPVSLDALVVTQAVLDEDTFRIWRESYTALDNFSSPDPGEGENQIGDPKLNGKGVHLHWTLPRGLRHGIQDQMTGELTFPLVPNRWLLTRFSGTNPRKAKSWVIESDCPHSIWSEDAKNGGHDLAYSTDHVIGEATRTAWAASRDPYRNNASPTTVALGTYRVPIGMAFDAQAAGSWKERAATDPLFLTAIGAGNPYFPSYTPHNSNIFSFIDDLADVPAADTLGYHVVGWYSNPSADVLATLPSGFTYPELLERLEWLDPRLTGNPTQDAKVTPATRSLYSGNALTVKWDPKSAPQSPLRQVRNGGALDAAIGNTTEDAFAALAGRAMNGVAPLDPAEMQLLRAFLHGVLPLADQSGGDALVQRSIRSSWFDASGGGYHWTLTPPPSPDGAPRTIVAPNWLDRLNDTQRALDEKLGELASAQWRLNALWLKRGQYDWVDPEEDGTPDPDEMDAELDPEQPGLAHTVRRLTIEARDLANAVPQPDPSSTHATAHAAMQAGIGSFAQARKIPEGANLKAIPKTPFWQPNNPVVALSGIQPSSDVIGDDEPLPVRAVDDHGSSLITRVTVSGKAITATPGQGAMPGFPNNAALPDTVLALLAEYFLLDPGNAAALAAAAKVSADAVTAILTAHKPSDYTGTLPAVGLQAWTQPWEPLFMEWKTRYLPIPYLVDKQRCWTFDGTDYRFTPGKAEIPDPDEPVVIKGISGLSPHPRSMFAARLEKFVTDHGTAEQREQLTKWIAAVGGWGFLAQEMTGFNDRLAARDPRAFRRPVAADPDERHIAELAGYPDAATSDGLPLRYRGRISTVPYLPGGDDAPFHETRQGQIYFEQLFLYDKFGRVLDVVNSDPKYAGLFDYKNFPVVVDDAFAADTKLDPDIESIAQLPPRLLQPARLDFDLLDGMTGTRIVGTDAEANPIGGWLLPNHLDHSLLLYDPAGGLLGTYRLLTTGGYWEPPPDATLTTLEQLAVRAPVVAGLIGSPQLANADNFTEFLDVIDQTLWSIDPLGARPDHNLSVLIGRPLALVQAQLRLRLDGVPIFPTGWGATLKLPEPEFTKHDFAVRLGDQWARDDGLVGYFTTDTHGAYRFDHFNSVAVPDGKQHYANQIGPLGPSTSPSATNYLQLTFAATTPTKLLLLMDPHAKVHAVTGITPTAEISIPPGHIQAPLDHIEALFHIGPLVTVPGTDKSIAFPQPSEKHGTWTWLQPAPKNTWIPHSLAPVVPDAQFPNAPTTVMDGLLRFTTNLDDPKQDH